MTKHDSTISRVCGTELELDVRAWDVGGKRLEDSELYAVSLHALPDGVYTVSEFMPNGGRYYYDHIYDSTTKTDNGHLEICTPECGSIDEAVTYELASEEIILSALDYLVASEYLSRYDLHKRVADDKGNFWGAHENYLTPLQLDPQEGDLYLPLASHLATRSVLTGAGRVSRRGFNVAQKIRSLDVEFSWTAHSRRPLVDLRHLQERLTPDDEKAHRIQISCGDANVSPWALRMKLGSTALLLRMVEQGVPLKDLTLSEPLKAAFIVAHDSKLTQSIVLDNGKSIRAVELQLEYAQRARLMSEKVPLPQEEIEIIKEWEIACDEAAHDPSSLKGKADWVTKRHYVDKIPVAPDETTINLRRAKDLQYDRLGEADGLGVKLRHNDVFAFSVSDHAIDQAMIEPPQQTRAAVRGNLIRAVQNDPNIRHRIGEVNWDVIQVDDATIELKSRTSHSAVIQKIIDSATV